MEYKEAPTKDQLVDTLIGLAHIASIRKERLNGTSKKCIDVARVCILAGANACFGSSDKGKLPTLEYLREARQWIKQALDADQKNADQKIREVLERLESLEASNDLASSLH